jgi:hypothetical protein
VTVPLTENQEKVWSFIRSCDRSPTYDEMEAATGMGRGQLNPIVAALKEKGYVDYIPYRARSLVALDPSHSLKCFKTSELMAELEQRGVRFGCAA